MHGVRRENVRQFAIANRNAGVLPVRLPDGKSILFDHKVTLCGRLLDVGRRCPRRRYWEYSRAAREVQPVGATHRWAEPVTPTQALAGRWKRGRCCVIRRSRLARRQCGNGRQLERAIEHGRDQPSGGLPSTGGSSNTGGLLATGGTATTGGQTSSGAAPATGGSSASATGGIAATGGAGTGGAQSGETSRRENHQRQIRLGGLDGSLDAGQPRRPDRTAGVRWEYGRPAAAVGFQRPGLMQRHHFIEPAGGKPLKRRSGGEDFVGLRAGAQTSRPPIRTRCSIARTRALLAASLR